MLLAWRPLLLGWKLCVLDCSRCLRLKRLETRTIEESVEAKLPTDSDPLDDKEKLLERLAGFRFVLRKSPLCGKLCMFCSFFGSMTLAQMAIDD